MEDKATRLKLHMMPFMSELGHSRSLKSYWNSSRLVENLLFLWVTKMISISMLSRDRMKIISHLVQHFACDMLTWQAKKINAQKCINNNSKDSSSNRWSNQNLADPPKAIPANRAELPNNSSNTISSSNTHPNKSLSSNSKHSSNSNSINKECKLKLSSKWFPNKSTNTNNNNSTNSNSTRC